MKHLIAVLFEVDGPDYYKAITDVGTWVHDHREGHALEVWPEGTTDVRVVQSFETDNDGQRVLYLPPENLDVEDPITEREPIAQELSAGDIEVSLEEEPEEDEEPYNGFP